MNFNEVFVTSMALNKKNIGARISKGMAETGLSAGDIAEHFGNSKAAVSKWKSGESLFGIELLEDVAKLLESNIGWLVSGRKKEINSNETETEGLKREIALQEKLIASLEKQIFMLENNNNGVNATHTDKTEQEFNNMVNSATLK